MPDNWQLSNTFILPGVRSTPIHTGSYALGKDGTVKKVEGTVKIESPASSAGKKAPFSSQLQNWVKDEGVDTRKMDPATATKCYKLKDWCVCFVCMGRLRVIYLRVPFNLERCL